MYSFEDHLCNLGHAVDFINCVHGAFLTRKAEEVKYIKIDFNGCAKWLKEFRGVSGFFESYVLEN